MRTFSYFVGVISGALCAFSLLQSEYGNAIHNAINFLLFALINKMSR